MNFLLSGNNVLGVGDKGKTEKREHFTHYGDVTYLLYFLTHFFKGIRLFDELQYCKLDQSTGSFVL